MLENFTIPSAEAVGEMLDYANAALRQADFLPLLPVPAKVYVRQL